jgi:diguanylate cyclase (GGDEF)-like protein
MIALIELLDRQPRAVRLGSAAALVAAITALAHAAGPAVAVPMLYVLPIAVVAWYAGWWRGAALSAVCALLWLGLEVAAAPAPLAPVPALVYWNTLLRLGCFAGLTYFVAALGLALTYARTDHLTGVANARAFVDAVQGEVQRMRRYGGAFTIAYLNVDDLRSVNGRFGRPVGDALVRSVSGLLRNCLRRTDLVARVGAGRFAILLPELGPETSQGFVRKLEGVLAGVAEKGLWTSGFSIGVGTFTDPPETVESALHRVEDLMYAARRGEAREARVRVQTENVAAPPAALRSAAP